MLELFPLFKNDKCTISEFVFEGEFICYALELPWRDNQKRISCIPAGTYELEYMKGSSSGKFKRCYYVKNVTGRSEILIHVGNYPADTLGCILPGLSHNFNSIWNSRAALNKLIKLQPEDLRVYR